MSGTMSSTQARRAMARVPAHPAGGVLFDRQSDKRARGHGRGAEIGPLAVAGVPISRRSHSRVRRRYRLELREASFRFVVGGVAAVIFLIQFAVASTTGDFYQRFPLLDLANMPQTFALGAAAGP